jgi:serine protease Do
MCQPPQAVFAFILLLTSSVSLAAERNLPDFSALVESNRPGVVNISTTQTVRRSPLAGMGAPDEPDAGQFNDFFRHYLGEEGSQEYFDSESLGSGSIISSDGYILTCAHVVENAREIIVKLTDRREFIAAIVGVDQRSDIALLKINASGLPKLTIGAPDKLRVGEWVLAIGSPFGFESSATSGIVSAKRRSLPKESYVPFIQTDVAINPGNSGGPLFNLKGEVVGVNSQIYSRTGGFMGLSFAVPIDLAMQIVSELKANGRFRRGWAGVTIQEVTRDLAEAFRLKKPVGALIADILPGSPAAKSDLKIGDVVVEYEGRNIVLSSDLAPLVGQTVPGTRARLKVMRGGQLQTNWLIVGELPEVVAAASEPFAPPSENGAQLGLSLRDLGPQQFRQLGIRYGVMVEGVANGPAYRAGVRKGDIIIQIDGRTARSAANLYAYLTRAPQDRPLPVLVRRGASALFLALRVKE